mgnify:CR=1 FL=1
MFSFNPEYAKRYGLQQSVILQYLIWWVIHNEVKGKNFRDGRHWTFNSVRAFAHEFPFLTQKQIRKCLKDLEGDGAILVASYNKMRADRTKWYSITDSLMLDIRKNKTYKVWKQKHLPKRANQYQSEYDNINNNNNNNTEIKPIWKK